MNLSNLISTIAKLFGGNINITKQSNCNNSPIVNGDNNSIQIGSPPPIVSKEQPANQNIGDFWYHESGREESGNGTSKI